MWKIFIEYPDKSKLTLAEKQGHTATACGEVLQRICQHNLQGGVSAVSEKGLCGGGVV